MWTVDITSCYLWGWLTHQIYFRFLSYPLLPYIARSRKWVGKESRMSLSTIRMAWLSPFNLKFILYIRYLINQTKHKNIKEILNMDLKHRYFPIINKKIMTVSFRQGFWNESFCNYLQIVCRSSYTGFRMRNHYKLLSKIFWQMWKSMSRIMSSSITSNETLESFTNHHITN